MYNVVETTNLYGMKCFDMQSTIDVENGFLVKKGDLVAGEKSVYTGGIPTATDSVYLVANPAWSYKNDSILDQNEENYINIKGVAYRTYELTKDRKFKVMDYGITPIDEDTAIAKGQFIVVNGTTNKPKAVAAIPESTTFVGKVVDVEEIGFPYCVGSYGTSLDNMGNVIDTRVTKVTIEVVKNA